MDELTEDRREEKLDACRRLLQVTGLEPPGRIEIVFDQAGEPRRIWKHEEQLLPSMRPA